MGQSQRASRSPPCPVTAAAPPEPAPGKGPAADPAFIDIHPLVSKRTGSRLCVCMDCSSTPRAAPLQGERTGYIQGAFLISDFFFFTPMATEELNALYNRCSKQISAQAFKRAVLQLKTQGFISCSGAASVKHTECTRSCVHTSGQNNHKGFLN